MSPILTRGHAGEHTGYVLDDALSQEYMSNLQSLRTSLPIDKEKKKTAAARRFFCAENEFEWIRDGLVSVIKESLEKDGTLNGDEATARVLPWMRFLEYSERDQGLGPHTDALIRCKETGVWSTHTLLVFCSDCNVGGETTLLPEDAKTTRVRQRKVQKARDAANELKSAIARTESDDMTTKTTSSARLDRLQTALQNTEESIAIMTMQAKPSFPVQPKCGRIFFFPHECPHEGRSTVSVPKIFLRAELILKLTTS